MTTRGRHVTGMGFTRLWTMAVAALVISVVAVFVAGASAWYTRSQARAATAEAKLARTPGYSAEVRDANRDGYFHRLELALTTPEAMDRVVVRLPERAGIRFTTSQSGVTAAGDCLQAESYDGQVMPGDTMAWRVELDPESYVENVRVRVESYCGREHWTSQVPLAVPFTGPPAIF